MPIVLATIFLNTSLIAGSALNQEFRNDVYRVSSHVTGQSSAAPVGFKAWAAGNADAAIKRKGG